MSEQFNPLRSQPGEFRVALCVTQLDDRAFEKLFVNVYEAEITLDCKCAIPEE